MPRGRKNLSLDEQLQEIDNQLSTLQSRREELVDKKHEEEEAGEEEGGGGDDGGGGEGGGNKGWLRGNAKLPKQVPATEEQKWLIESTGKE